MPNKAQCAKVSTTKTNNMTRYSCRVPWDKINSTISLMISIDTSTAPPAMTKFGTDAKFATLVPTAVAKALVNTNLVTLALTLTYCGM